MLLGLGYYNAKHGQILPSSLMQPRKPSCIHQLWEKIKDVCHRPKPLLFFLRVDFSQTLNDKLTQASP